MAPDMDSALGADVLPEGGVRFAVWAPRVETMVLELLGSQVNEHPMARSMDGIHSVTVPHASAGTDYWYRVDAETRRPDPRSRYQAHGVHGPSQIVDPADFSWTDEDWIGIELDDYVIYEIHVGTFTPEGTFLSAIAKLDHLVALGITAVELMPVAAFPGDRNWGYDGVHLFAPQVTYGGPEGLRAFVNACHRRGLVVILDVVYNHLGPEGNYLHAFGPYFTTKYKSPWGEPLNFDDEDSPQVRRYFRDNAVYWLEEFHIDSLRLDAVHAIQDLGARHVLEELNQSFHFAADRLRKKCYLIAESDLNDSRVINPPHRGGHGFDSQWLDDFHHAMHVVLTGRDQAFLGDYRGLPDLKKCLQNGYVYTGQYSAHRRRFHGNSSTQSLDRQFVIFNQNHDQVANTCEGERLVQIVGRDLFHTAALVLLASPFVPMLFMGEEWGEMRPFEYFTDFGDENLARAVTRGRRKEHKGFLGSGRKFQDPQDRSTFTNSRIDWEAPSQPDHAGTLRLYRDLIALRRANPALGVGGRQDSPIEIDEDARWIRQNRKGTDDSLAEILVNFSESRVRVPVSPASQDLELKIWTRDPIYSPATSATPLPARLRAGGREQSLTLVEMDGPSAAIYMTEKRKSS